MKKLDIKVSDGWHCLLDGDKTIWFNFKIIAKIKINGRIFYAAIKVMRSTKSAWPILFDQYGRQANDNFGGPRFSLYQKTEGFKSIEILQ